MANDRRAGPRPPAALAWFLRLPIWLYRARLGRLLGHRFLLLTHLGRRTGRARQTVVEVVRYDPTTRESVVVSPWGERTDWYRNIQAHPAIEVRTGALRYVPAQRFLSAEELSAVLDEYERRHPLAARVIGALFGVRAGLRAVDRFRGVAFQPANLPGVRG